MRARLISSLAGAKLCYDVSPKINSNTHHFVLEPVTQLSKSLITYNYYNKAHISEAYSKIPYFYHFVNSPNLKCRSYKLYSNFYPAHLPRVLPLILTENESDIVQDTLITNPCWEDVVNSLLLARTLRDLIMKGESIHYGFYDYGLSNFRETLNLAEKNGINSDIFAQKLKNSVNPEVVAIVVGMLLGAKQRWPLKSITNLDRELVDHLLSLNNKDLETPIILCS